MKVDEYDAATQGQIRKLMFEQKQKRMGIESPEEKSMADIMASLPPMPGSEEEAGGGA